MRKLQEISTIDGKAFIVDANKFFYVVSVFPLDDKHYKVLLYVHDQVELSLVDHLMLKVPKKLLYQKILSLISSYENDTDELP